MDVLHQQGSRAELGLSGSGRALDGSLRARALAEVVAHESQLLTGRRFSHVFSVDTPTYQKVLVVTDAVIKIVPNLEDKVGICQNAIHLATSFDIAPPKVAILAAVETVTWNTAPMIDAAALCKMAERGQIHGGLPDGPLAFDNAIHREAARTKGIRSDVSQAIWKSCSRPISRQATC